MKKKVIMLGAGLTLGSALVVSSALAGIGGAKGYDAFKSAMKNTAAAVSATQQVAVSITDNGNELVSIKTVLKENEGIGVSGTAAIDAGSESQTLKFYEQDGKHYFNIGNDNTYYEAVGSERSEWRDRSDRSGDAKIAKELENVVDALVGNLKNQVIASEAANGETSVDLTLTGSQIPTPVNVIGSLIIKQALNSEHTEAEWDRSPFGPDAFGFDVEEVKAQFPKLTDDVNIDEVALHATIDADNYVRDKEVDFTISGKDASGKSHTLVIGVDIATTDINTTTPDTLDLTGKKVTTIQESDFNN